MSTPSNVRSGGPMPVAMQVAATTTVLSNSLWAIASGSLAYWAWHTDHRVTAVAFAILTVLATMFTYTSFRWPVRSFR